MDDQNLPDSIGSEVVKPPALTPKEEELCQKLDELHSNYNLKVKPSDMFRGAIFTMRSELRSNPDWMAQSANSLREILYPFSHDGIPNKEEALRQFGSVRVDTELGDELGRVFGTLTELAHHGNGKSSSVDYLTYTSVQFEELVARFENIMFDVMSRQIDVHNEIDQLLKSAPSVLDANENQL
ncbi:MAG TPA: hypothetical protein PKD34_02675 [Candidatus Doudnabacteria bacterium]|nr:hypothetical protein [Candidatus Doudnabacteria bacterium]